jgi:hypothetical protein
MLPCSDSSQIDPKQSGVTARFAVVNLGFRWVQIVTRVGSHRAALA